MSEQRPVSWTHVRPVTFLYAATMTFGILLLDERLTWSVATVVAALLVFSAAVPVHHTAFVISSVLRSRRRKD